MKDSEKQAKLKALKSINSSAKKAMTGGLSKKKDSPELKKHVAEMSKETGIDFKNDSDNIADPMQNGKVIGRKVSEANDDCDDVGDRQSVYDIDVKLAELMKKKEKYKR